MRDFLNRPMLQTDLSTLKREAHVTRVRSLVHEYRSQALPVMNGSFAYSNLLEGPSQVLTCHPYRLWEYTSLFRVLGDKVEERRFIDIGGAASAMPYLLAENGYVGVAVDLQPLLVDVCNYVATVRGLNLKAIMGDISKDKDFENLSGQFDLVTFISVLEHIAAIKRSALFHNICRLLKPGGLLYMTFDYGSYTARTTYCQHETESEEISESIIDIGPLCEIITRAGFRFLGNDPRSLPEEMLEQKAAPGYREVMRRSSLNVGPIDGETPWLVLLKYVVKRVFRFTRAASGRYAQHNFFRMFLEKV